MGTYPDKATTWNVPTNLTLIDANYSIGFNLAVKCLNIGGS